MNPFFNNPEINNIPFPAYWVDENANIVHVNTASCEQLEYTYNELIQKKINDVSLDFHASNWEDLKKLLFENKFYQFESRHISKSGKIIPVEVTVSVIKNGNSVYYLGFAQEMNENLLSRSFQRDQSFLLEALFNFIEEPLSVLDQNYQILNYNKTVRSLLNIDVFSGKKCYQLLGEEDFCNDCPSKKVFRDSKIHKIEKKLSKKDVWLELQSFPIHDEKGKVIKVVELMRDITKRKKIEKKLYATIGELQASQSETLLSNFVIDNAGHAIFMISETGKFVRVNNFACELWKYSREELLKMYVWDINTTLNKQTFRKIWKKLETEKFFQTETIHKNKDGELIDVEINSNLLNYEGKMYSVGFAKDITFKKKSERKLKEALNEIQTLKSQLEAENIYLQDEIRLVHNFEEIVTQNKNLKLVLSDVEKVASTESTVLILGETGTGKELIARAIHNISKRKNRPLVKVNCAALPTHLIESELFGYEKGAFTGALTQKIGRFELADHGTIFLDEIGELPLELQPKLLRVLQDGEFERLGSTKTIKVNVRLICATNRKLADEVKKGNFRADLFYRINVFPVSLPALRERKEDIPILVNHFINKYSAKLGKKIINISHQTMARFQMYDWPGNIRELENVIERAMITSIGTELEYSNDFIELESLANNKSDLSLSFHEKEYIQRILKLTDFRIRGEKGAAKILNLKPTTLEARMKKLGIKR